MFDDDEEIGGFVTLDKMFPEFSADARSAFPISVVSVNTLAP